MSLFSASIKRVNEKEKDVYSMAKKGKVKLVLSELIWQRNSATVEKAEITKKTHC